MPKQDEAKLDGQMKADEMAVVKKYVYIYVFICIYIYIYRTDLILFNSTDAQARWSEVRRTDEGGWDGGSPRFASADARPAETEGGGQPMDR